VEPCLRLRGLLRDLARPPFRGDEVTRFVAARYMPLLSAVSAHQYMSRLLYVVVLPVL